MSFQVLKKDVMYKNAQDLVHQIVLGDNDFSEKAEEYFTDNIDTLDFASLHYAHTCFNNHINKSKNKTTVRRLKILREMTEQELLRK